MADSYATDFAFVQGVRRRIEAMRSSKANPVEPPTVSELEEALGEAVEKCDLFAKNWRNRIYRIQLARGPNLRAGAELEKVQIIDIAPTLLQLFGVPIPQRHGW